MTSTVPAHVKHSDRHTLRRKIADCRVMERLTISALGKPSGHIDPVPYPHSSAYRACWDLTIE
jgi:hypothetical protein